MLSHPWLNGSEEIERNSPLVTESSLRGCSVNGEPVNMAIFSSIVRFKQKKLGYTDS